MIHTEVTQEKKKQDGKKQFTAADERVWGAARQERRGFAVTHC